MSDISVSFAVSAMQRGRLMPPDARRKKFGATGEHTTTGGFLPINQPPDPVPVRRAAPGRDGPCLWFRPATGSGPGRVKYVLLNPHQRSGNGPLKTSRVPQFRDGGLA